MDRTGARGIVAGLGCMVGVQRTAWAPATCARRPRVTAGERWVASVLTVFLPRRVIHKIASEDHGRGDQRPEWLLGRPVEYFCFLVCD